jgi:predicted nucleic acid-binding protein
VGSIERLGRGPVALDTVSCIYFIEEHPTYLPLVEPVRTPDALQIAAALSGRCVALVTNDRELRAIAGLEVMRLSGDV